MIWLLLDMCRTPIARHSAPFILVRDGSLLARCADAIQLAVVGVDLRHWLGNSSCQIAVHACR